VLAIIGASVLTGDKTDGTSNARDEHASVRKQRLYLMHVAEKLRFMLNALHRGVGLRSSRTCSPPRARGDPMASYKVVVSPSAKWTRVLLSHGPDELLRAILPPPSQIRHERTAATFLESLALWLDTTLPVVLSVDAR